MGLASGGLACWAQIWQSNIRPESLKQAIRCGIDRVARRRDT
jgi:hypothetical protein